MKNILLLLGSLFFLASCHKSSILDTSGSLRFVHVAHSRMNGNSSFNEALGKAGFEDFDLRLLGGDLALNSSGDYATMDSLHKIFNLSDENTLWALGNHDYADLNLVSSFTNRKNFYAHQSKQITFLILDTQDSLSNFVGDQLALINSVLDTISASKYLFLIHHKLIWLYGNEDLERQADNIANGNLGDCFYCTNPNNFYDAVYPKLVEVKKRGIEVFCIGGDLGHKIKTFYYLTEEGIHFLASGMNNNDEDNKVIVFEYNTIKHDVKWRFIDLSLI